MTSPQLLANMCELVYRADPTYSENGAEVLTLQADGTLYCIFRGTTLDGLDILNDLRAVPWKAKEFDDIRLHSGFYKALVGNSFIPSFDWRGYSFSERLGNFFSPDDGLWEKMRDRVLGYQGRIEFVGHSKGAAEAQIAALLAYKEGCKVDKVTGFGSPRVGGPEFLWRMGHLDIDLFRLGIDCVTEVPKGVLFDYMHVRAPIQIQLPFEDEHPFNNHKISQYIKYVPMV